MLDDHKTKSLSLPVFMFSGVEKDVPAQLLAAISEKVWELPFEAVCTTGAPVQDAGAECSDLKCEFSEPHTLHGSFAYAFTEETNLGCSDQRFTDRVRGRFHFSYDRQTGMLKVDVPRIQQAEYDPEEF